MHPGTILFGLSSAEVFGIFLAFVFIATPEKMTKLSFGKGVHTNKISKKKSKKKEKEKTTTKKIKNKKNLNSKNKIPDENKLISLNRRCSNAK